MGNVSAAFTLVRTCQPKWIFESVWFFPQGIAKYTYAIGLTLN